MDAGQTPKLRAVSPFLELGAYEALWSDPALTFKRAADMFRQNAGALPSDLVPEERARAAAREVVDHLRGHGVSSFGVRVHGEFSYPPALRDAAHPLEVLYFRGAWDLLESPCIAVVGTRHPTAEGVKRTRKLVRSLVQDGWTIVSGLAEGVDTAAHEAALEFGGRTIAVIGTPLCEVYPKQNAALQERIGRDFLVVSQVPVQRYLRQDWRMNRTFFPERNVTMSALTKATVIVEAGETSGSLIQARAAISQGRKLFVLDSCFRRGDITWPERMAKKGAVRVVEYTDIQRVLPPPVREAN